VSAFSRLVLTQFLSAYSLLKFQASFAVKQRHLWRAEDGTGHGTTGRGMRQGRIGTVL